MKEKYKPIIYCALLSGFQGLMYLLGKLSPLKAHMVGNSIDNVIPFVPIFIYAYVSWYVMLFIIPTFFYYKNKTIFLKYCYSIFVSIIICFLIYILFPTAMIRPETSISGVTGFIIKTVYWVDTPILNCFPSMHCLISFILIYFSLFEKEVKPVYKLITIVWGLLIVLSTVFVKQHVVIDVISAFVISILVFIFVNKSKKIKEKISKSKL